MLELGGKSRILHLEIASEVTNNNIDLVYAVGLRMRDMFDALPAAKQAYWSETSEELLSVIISHLQHGDVVCYWRRGKGQGFRKGKGRWHGRGLVLGTEGRNHWVAQILTCSGRVKYLPLATSME